MFAMSFLQEGPNTGLMWLFYILLAFLLLVVIVGALTSREKTESASKSRQKTEDPASKPRSPVKAKRSFSRKK